MKLRLKALVIAIAFGSTVATATASSVITNITASGPGLGSFEMGTGNHSGGYGRVQFSNSLSSVNPITLTFTVEHTDVVLLPYDVYQDLTNSTGSAFTGFHVQISEPVPPKGVVFSSFDEANEEFGPSFAPSFTLDAPSKDQPAPFNQTGPLDLNFTGGLAAGATATDAYYSLNMPDPGAGNSYTFTLTQTPAVAVVPEPETYAMFLAGLGLMGFMAKRRKQIT
jgi:hypothetical protein